jgi:Tol biopolymer transport system component
LNDGSTIKSFPIIGNSLSPAVAWWADGSSVVYISTDQKRDDKVAWRQKLDGSEREKLTSFGGEGIFDLAIALDGSTLAVAQGEWKNDAALITGLR